MNTCTRDDIEAFLTVQLPTDLVGRPFSLYSDIMHNDSATIEMYACNNCLEQFGGEPAQAWQNALDHVYHNKKEGVTA